jgi:hypothetical protein
MKTIHRIAGVVLVLLLAAAAYGILRTEPPAGTLVAQGGHPGKTTSEASQPIVDQTPLKIAQQLAPLATLPEERPLALEAIRLTDHEVDLAFTTALRDAAQPKKFRRACRKRKRRWQPIKRRSPKSLPRKPKRLATRKTPSTTNSISPMLSRNSIRMRWMTPSRI